MPSEYSRSIRVLPWILGILAVLLLAAGYYLYRRSGPATEPRLVPGPSSEWTTAPEGGVPVTLPKVRMTNAPATPAPTPTSAERRNDRTPQAPAREPAR